MRLRWGGLRWRRRAPAMEMMGETRAPSLPVKSWLWSGLGALVLGVMLARWSWVLFAPHAPAAAVTLERGVSAEVGRLFGVAVAVAAPKVEVPPLPNVQLVGVFAAGPGKPGFAVLKVDGKQTGVAVGESVASGTKLLEVHADYALLEHAGAQQRVNLEVKGASAVAAK